jgi:ABC-2 type transport system ATP-binding protein
MYCIETLQLTHRFSKQETVLNQLNLKVPQGSIYGFLGPNGAGKTTTLRLILGLLKIQNGRVEVFGKSMQQHRVPLLKTIGSLIEMPSVYGHLSAKENLRLIQQVHQCKPSRIDAVLQLVKLSHTGSKRSGQFSLGMKQRLGIAMALMHEPQLLILDEPTNGLDPNGILEMRELLKTLNEELGISMVVSSHLLAEMEKLVSHLGIISKGHLVFEGTLDMLKQKQQQMMGVWMHTSDMDTALEVARAMGIHATVHDQRMKLPALDKETLATLNAQLVHRGIGVYEMTIEKNDLENIFMGLINN